MKKLLKRMLLFILAVVIACGTLIVPAGAASTKQAKLSSLSSSKYIQCYTLKSSGKVYGYTNSSLKTQMGYIDCATDECYILSVSGSAIQVSLPTSSGRVTRWFKRSDFTATDISKSLNVKNATAQITTYRRADGKTSYGYVGKGDDIYVLGTSGSYTQIIYELSTGNWKMGWIKTTDANKYLKNIVEPTGIKLSSGNFTLSGSGKTKTLSVTFTPSNTTAKDITWTSSNTKVATVSSSGKVTSVSNGTATITAKTSNGKTASVKVTVSAVSPTGISLSSGNFTLTGVGSTKTLTATITPTNATSKTVTWSSSNTSVATVSSSGKVTAKKAGTATITAKTSNGKTASVKVTVKINSTTSLPTKLFLTQNTSTSCTLCSAAMMLRAKSYRNGVSTWANITESAIKSTAWAGSAGLKHSWSYSDGKYTMSVTHKSVNGITVASLKALLDAHPEGIVLYVKLSSSNNHAVFLTRYSGDTFYCADPNSYYSGKELTLSASSLGSNLSGHSTKNRATQSDILSSVCAYWYIASCK